MASGIFGMAKNDGAQLDTIKEGSFTKMKKRDRQAQSQNTTLKGHQQPSDYLFFRHGGNVPLSSEPRLSFVSTPVVIITTIISMLTTDGKKLVFQGQHYLIEKYCKKGRDKAARQDTTL